MDEGRAEEALADQSGAPGAAGAGVLLVEGHLEVDRKPPSAVLGRPADAGPSAGGELALPLHPLGHEGVFVAGPAPVAEDFEVAHQVLRHPGGDLLAEGALVDLFPGRFHRT